MAAIICDEVVYATSVPIPLDDTVIRSNQGWSSQKINSITGDKSKLPDPSTDICTNVGTLNSKLGKWVQKQRIVVRDTQSYTVPEDGFVLIMNNTTQGTQSTVAINGIDVLSSSIPISMTYRVSKGDIITSHINITIVMSTV